MIAEAICDRILARAAALEQSLKSAREPQEIVRLSQEYAEVEDAVKLIREHRAIAAEIEELEGCLDDSELRVLAEEEIVERRERAKAAEEALYDALLLPDSFDRRPAIIEVRAGAGGLEASHFVADLVRMYQRYAQKQRWKFEVVEEHATSAGGSRETIASVRGKGVFARMKHEAGVHRVQRVPETESSGRLHTSTATVAVLPEPDEIEIEIDPEEIRVETMRASGAGGQHVNVTDSAVRITHVPTGIRVISSEKSQHRNRAKAMQVLRARLFELKQAESGAERDTSRRGQIGSGERSEKVRTYNFPQNRVTDHRLGETFHNLPGILAGALDEIQDQLVSAERAARLAELEA